MAKEQLKNEKAKRKDAEKLYKIIKHDLVMALKERDENYRVIQERVVENREGEIARLTELIEKGKREALEAEIKQIYNSASINTMREE